jgi:Flp pilus assembly protein CpaB
MAYTPENNKGRLFDQGADKTKPSQPDYAGSAVVNGVHVRVSAWHYPPSERQRVGTLSLAIEDYAEWQEKRRKAAGTKSADDQRPPPPADDSDIPF